jgi:hypothetical protein
MAIQLHWSLAMMGQQEGLRKRIICKTFVPGREEEIHIGLRIQNSIKRANLLMVDFSI